MAKSFSLTCPKSVLEKIIPDFDVKGGNAGWVKTKIKKLLDDALTSIDADADLPEFKASGETMQMMMSVGGTSETTLKTLASRTGFAESDVARRLLCSLSKKQLSDVAQPIPSEALLFTHILKSAGYDEVRPEQTSFYMQNKASLFNGKIGLSEAATGTGKTVSMLISAAEVAVETNTRVVIAVPTISLIHQFKAAYDAARKVNALSLKDSIEAHLNQSVDLRSIFGRREFVSQFALESLIESGELPEELAKAADAWLQSVKQSSDINPDLWLVHSLDEATRSVGEFPLNEVRIQELVMNDDLGFLAYRRQMARASIHDAEIVLVTHAMLGVDFRSRLFVARGDEEHAELTDIIKGSFKEFIAAHKDGKELKRAIKRKDINDADAAVKANSIGEIIANQRNIMDVYKHERGRVLVKITEENGMIPAYQYLMVDECHQFESNLSRILSTSVTLRRIGRELKELKSAGGKVTKLAIKEVNLALKAISESCPSKDDESGNEEVVFLNTNASDDKFYEIVEAIKTIVRVLSELKPPKDSADIEIKKIYAALKRDLIPLRAVTKGAIGMMNYSPARKFPQIIVGRPSMESFLSQLWAFVVGASCVSATIYLPKGDGLTGWYLKTVLAIPDHREAEYAPSAGAWIYRPVTEVWQPKTELDVHALTPPAMKEFKDDATGFELATKVWHQSIATTVTEKILKTAGGGILVLATSYRTCEDVSDYLKLMAPDVHVVTAIPGFTLAQQKAAFIALRKENKPTAWVATGGAWTGLDVSGNDIGLSAEEDNLLTDLVIPRLPFNTNRSITHQSRKTTIKSMAWAMETYETCFAFRQGLGRLVRRPGIPKNRRIWVLDGRLSNKGDAQFSIFQKILDKYIR